jgi:hypothetical protein
MKPEKIAEKRLSDRSTGRAAHAGVSFIIASAARPLAP